MEREILKRFKLIKWAYVTTDVIDSMVQIFIAYFMSWILKLTSIGTMIENINVFSLLLLL